MGKIYVIIKKILYVFIVVFFVESTLAMAVSTHNGNGVNGVNGANGADGTNGSDGGNGV
jgi:hypothetical protein